MRLISIVGIMALIRILSGLMELTSAGLMLYFGRVETALRINGILALAGPAVLLAVTAVGLAGLAEKISPEKSLLILGGVLLIFLGTR